ncbi:HAD-IA family hydrolase [Ferruginivarius sediminum]|nr:HAD-IA family hydrolase [Ferruginivarius sediminum]
MAPVLLCDLDGTLVDTVADLTVALNRLLTERGLGTLPQRRVRGLVGRGAARLVESGLAEMGGAVGPDGLSACVARFLEIYEAAPAVHSRPYPGVIETLTSLRAAGWRLGVCTNKPQAPSEAILDAFELSPFFEAVGGGDRFPVRKPDGGHLHATLELIMGGDAKAARAVLVGDSRTDLDAARNARLPVVLVDYGYTDVPAAELGGDAVISSFAALPEALEGIVADGPSTLPRTIPPMQ